MKAEPGERPNSVFVRGCQEEIALDIVNEKVRTAVSGHMLHMILFCQGACLLGAVGV